MAATPGSGQRFKQLVKRLKSEGGINDPNALAAELGRKKYGQKKMTDFSLKGRKRKSGY